MMKIAGSDTHFIAREHHVAEYNSIGFFFDSDKCTDMIIRVISENVTVLASPGVKSNSVKRQ